MNEKTPIPAVASEVVAYAKSLLVVAPDDRAAENAHNLLMRVAGLLQRAQADALDARRYRILRNSADECYVLSISVAHGSIGPTTLLQGSDLDAAIDAAIDDAALRTSSPDPVVPRGEDGEKGK